MNAPAADTVGGDVKRITRMAVPLYLSMVVVSFSALINTAVLGRHATAALAGFAVTVAVYSPAMAAVSGAVRGIMPLLASKTDDRAGLLTVVRDGTWLAVVVGVVGGGAVAAVPLLATASGVPDRTIESLGAFPWLMAGGVLLNGFGSMATSSLVALGNSKAVLPAGLAGAACTAILSFTLVTGFGPFPELGLAGSGWALLLSNLVITTVMLAALRKHLGVPLRNLISARFHVRKVLALAKVGIPMAGTVLVKFAVLGVLALAAARISTSDAAVHNIATSLVGITFTAAVAVGQAGLPVISRYAATDEPARLYQGVRAGLIVVMIALGVLCTLGVVFRSGIAGLFTADPSVSSTVALLLPLVAVAILGDGIQAVLGFGLTALKRTVPSFLVFAVVYGALALVSIPIATTTGITGLWTTLVVANALVAIGQGLAFRRVAARVVAEGTARARQVTE
ncbi:MATE family efflux transporter [Actinoalloteichus hymeniacidonis]|uniref:Probable multidrug resistance protein NorM n=1 Tax=Actinoalloteichus hymeniacidonis TaxID=340345 RepID=A0AAC9HQX2_9PSEU|nr:MATE family efflux transporter [Actinoalloteichus hymeniacidonis]AOS63790.1 Na+-driven multidrug efflux pump [Actinoalloteichus hymeniacidonis]MBB5908156.1 MATE family multidrug resistance protein [Actinoalloteichus hymeniacidonis]